jgi:hypothetical protein
MTEHLATMCQNTYTVEDMHRRLGVFHQCLESILFHGTTSFDVHERMEAGLQFAATIASADDVGAIRAWGPAVWGTFSAEHLAQQIHSYEEVVAALPTFMLYVPVSLTPSATATLGSWCRTQLNPSLMLEIKVDAAVTGGCAFVHNSLYHDYSLHRAITSQAGMVTKLLSSYG